jgi:hypothetical protein
MWAKWVRESWKDNVDLKFVIFLLFRPVSFVHYLYNALSSQSGSFSPT